MADAVVEGTAAVVAAAAAAAAVVAVVAPVANGLGVVGTVAVVVARSMVETREGIAAVAMAAVDVHEAVAATTQSVQREAAATEGGCSLAATGGRATCVAQGDTTPRAPQPWTAGANALYMRSAVVVAFGWHLSAAANHRRRCSTRCHSRPLRAWPSYWSARTRALLTASPGGAVPRRHLQRRSLHRGPRRILGVQHRRYRRRRLAD